jgi:hypothetical protein
MTKKIDALVDEAMSQAQVFASAWSLVGGIFDHGNALENAEVEKKALRALIADLLSASIADTAKPSLKDHARQFATDFTREIGFAMSDHAQEVMLNLFLKHAASAQSIADTAGAKPLDLLPNALWTRRGSGTDEWWSFKGYQARKDAADQWVLRKGGEELYRHTYLQVVMAHAERALLAATPASSVADAAGAKTTLNFDGTVDITCAHCGGNGCFACLRKESGNE